MGMNMSIGCLVKDCKYHHEQEKYCTLEQISIEQEKIKQSNTETDCANFKKK